MALEIVRDGRIQRLAMNRPEKRNALNLELCRALVSELRDANESADVGCVLLSGAGKAFCAGMDLSEAADVDRDELAAIHHQLFTFNSWMRKPVVAAVRGAALAGGTGLVANAHVVIAEEDASFGLTEIRIGLWPVLIFPAVVRAVGERRAVELAMTGRVFKAREAERFGLATEVVEAGAFETRAAEVAGALSQTSIAAMRAGLEYVDSIRNENEQEALHIGKLLREQMMTHPDFREGIHAWQEKRPPKWPSWS